jgi:hypothetical protein
MSAKTKPTGGSTSPLDEHAERLLALVAEQPDLTLDEIVAGEFLLQTDRSLGFDRLRPRSKAANSDPSSLRLSLQVLAFSECRQQRDPARTKDASGRPDCPRWPSSGRRLSDCRVSAPRKPPGARGVARRSIPPN